MLWNTLTLVQYKPVFLVNVVASFAQRNNLDVLCPLIFVCELTLDLRRPNVKNAANAGI